LSSPLRPRFIVAQDPVLTPPFRVVTNAAVAAAAGQSGTIQSSPATRNASSVDVCSGVTTSSARAA
jgi:hypothetical protein